VKQLGPRHIRLLPLLDEADYNGLLAATDIKLILQAAGTGQYFFSQQAAFGASDGVPVLSAADGDSELAKAVAEGDSGKIYYRQIRRRWRT